MYVLKPKVTRSVETLHKHASLIVQYKSLITWGKVLSYNVILFTY